MKSTEENHEPIAKIKKTNSFLLLIGLVLLLGTIGFYFFYESGEAGITIGDPVVTEVNQEPNDLLPEINGRNVNFISLENGYLRHLGNRKWIEEDLEFKSGYEYREQSRNDESVYLFDKSRNLKLQLNLKKMEILHSDNKTKNKESSIIKEAFKNVKGAYVKKVIYKDGNGKEGSFAKVPGTKTWLEYNSKLQKAGGPKQLKEISRGEWLVFLKDESGDEIALDLYAKEVKIKRIAQEFEVLYLIKNGI